eukprot:s1511_g7.t1
MAAPSSDRDTPRVFLLDGAALLESRRRLRAGDKSLEAPLARLLKDADEKLSAGPFSVTAKKSPPPSGNLHDYCSVGPYWWPDPSKPDGLPYIRKDGHKNPDRGKIGDSGLSPACWARRTGSNDVKPEFEEVEKSVRAILIATKSPIRCQKSFPLFPDRH